MLEERVKRLSSFAYKYHSIIASLIIMGTGIYVIGGYCINVKLPVKKVKSEVESARAQGIEVIEEYGKGVWKNGGPPDVYIINPKDGSRKLIYQPSLSLKYIYVLCGVLGATVGSLVYRRYKREKLVPIKFTSREYAIRMAACVSSGAAYFALFWAAPLKDEVRMGFSFIFTPMSIILANSWYRDWLLNNRYRDALHAGDKKSIYYMHGRTEELRRLARIAYKKGDMNYACRLIAEDRALVRQHLKYASVWYNCNYFSTYAFLYSRLMVRLFPKFHGAVKLMINTHPNADFSIGNNTIERVIKNEPERGDELRLLDFEFCITPKDRLMKAAELYKSLKLRGALSQYNVGSKSSVAALQCGCIGKAYVVKRGGSKEIALEQAQTERIAEGLARDNTVFTQEFAAVIGQNELPNEDGLGNDSLAFIAYAHGELLSAYLNRKIKTNREMTLCALTKAVIANAKTADFGLNPNVENRKAKLLEDIARNNGLSERHKEALASCLPEICLKFAGEFPSVYDRDGNSDNLISKDWNMVAEEKEGIYLIDLDYRPQSDPAYMAVKGIEHKCALGYDSLAGYHDRNGVISAHFDQLKMSGHCLEHYYLSVLLKTVSYIRFSHGRQNTQSTRLGFIESGLFAVNTLLDKHSGAFSCPEAASLSVAGTVFGELRKIELDKQIRQT